MRFRPDAPLMDARRSLHDFVDTLWRHGEYTRSEVYGLLESVTGERGVHVSSMSLDEIVGAASALSGMFKGYADCSRCRNALRRNSIGVAVCGLTGEPFYRSVYGEGRGFPRKCKKQTGA